MFSGLTQLTLSTDGSMASLPSRQWRPHLRASGLAMDSRALRASDDFRIGTSSVRGCFASHGTEYRAGGGELSGASGVVTISARTGRLRGAAAMCRRGSV